MAKPVTSTSSNTVHPLLSQFNKLTDKVKLCEENYRTLMNDNKKLSDRMKKYEEKNQALMDKAEAKNRKQLNKLDRFCNSVSLLGLTYVMSDYKFGFRLFSGMLVLACIGLTVLQVGNRIQWYIKNPISVDVEQKKLQSVTFPTILLCPGTQYRCSWLNGENCNISEAVGEQGRCFKVSPPSRLSTLQNSDTTYSLDLLLSLEHYLEIPGINIDPDKIQLYLIPPDKSRNEHTISSWNKFTIAPGKHHEVAITKINEINRYHTRCKEKTLKYSDIYTNLNCMLDNRADRLAQLCGCKPAINAIQETKLPQDTHLCNFIEELICLNKRNSMSSDGKLLESNCIDDCHSVSYEVDLSLESLDTSTLLTLLPSNWPLIKVDKLTFYSRSVKMSSYISQNSHFTKPQIIISANDQRIRTLMRQLTDEFYLPFIRLRDHPEIT